MWPMFGALWYKELKRYTSFSRHHLGQHFLLWLMIETVHFVKYKKDHHYIYITNSSWSLELLSLLNSKAKCNILHWGSLFCFFFLLFNCWNSLLELMINIATSMFLLFYLVTFPDQLVQIIRQHQICGLKGDLHQELHLGNS